MRGLLVLSLAALASTGFAESSIFGPGKFFELRSFSGLPGAGFGLLENGNPSIEGAVSLSTPIGFSLGGGLFDVGLIDRSDDDAPQMINYSTHSHFNSHGNGQVMFGIGTPAGNFTATYQVMSSEFDQIYDAQWQLPLKWKDGGVSVGCQNITNRPVTASDSRSFYAVGTYQVSHGDYVSLGYGDARFKGVFGNASALITTRLKATLEYDTMSWNAGLAWSFGRIQDLGDNFDRNETTLWTGFLDGQNLAIALNFAF